MSWANPTWVGSGADRETEEERRRREEEERRGYRPPGPWDPGRRLGEIGRALETDPWRGVAEVINLPGEVIGTGFKYASGVIGAGIQQAGLMNVGSSNAVGPQGGRVDWGPLGGVRMVPPISNPFDPVEAVTRFETGLLPPAGAATEFLANAAGTAKVMKVGGAVLGAAGRSAPIQDAVGGLKALDTPLALGVGEQIGKLASAPSWKTTGAAGAGITAAAAASGAMTTPEGESGLGRAVEYGLYGLAPASLFFGVKLGGSRLVKAADDFRMDPETAAQRILDAGGTAADAAAERNRVASRIGAQLHRRAEPPPGTEEHDVWLNTVVNYPGGSLKFKVDEFLARTFNRLASVTNLQDYADTVFRAKFGYGIPADMRFEDRMRFVQNFRGHATAVAKNQFAPILHSAGVNADNVDDFAGLHYITVGHERAQRGLTTGKDFQKDVLMSRDEMIDVLRAAQASDEDIAALGDLDSRTFVTGVDDLLTKLSDQWKRNQAAQGQRASVDRATGRVVTEPMVGYRPNPTIPPTGMSYDDIPAGWKLEPIPGTNQMAVNRVGRSPLAPGALDAIRDWAVAKGGKQSSTGGRQGTVAYVPALEAQGPALTPTTHFVGQVVSGLVQPGMPLNKKNVEQLMAILKDRQTQQAAAKAMNPNELEGALMRLRSIDPQVRADAIARLQNSGYTYEEAHAVIRELASSGAVRKSWAESVEHQLDAVNPAIHPDEAKALISQVRAQEDEGLRKIAQERRDFKVKQIDDVYGPGTADRWIQAQREMTGVLNNYALRKGIDSGLIKPEDAQHMIEEVGIYAAIKNAEDALRDIVSGKPRSSGDVRYFAPEKGIDHWHNDDVMVHMDTGTFMNHYVEFLSLAERNRVMRNFDETADRLPGKFDGIYRKIDPEGKPVDDSRVVPPGWQKVPVFIEGKQQWRLVADWLYDALDGMNEPQADMLSRMAGAWGEPFRLGVTVWSPAFIVRNWARDFQQMIQNKGMDVLAFRNVMGAYFEVLTGGSGNGLAQWLARHQGNPLVDGFSARVMHGLENFFLGPEGRMMDEMLQSGIGSSTITKQLLSHRQEDVVKALGLGHQGARGMLAKGGAVVTKPKDIMEAMSQLSDLSNRLAIYRTVHRGKQGSWWLGQGEGKTADAAAMEAKQILVDFSRGGGLMKIASMWLPLLNARTQGELSSLKAFEQDPQGFLLRTTASVAIPTVLTYAWNRGVYGDLYDKIPVEERDRNHLIIVSSYTIETTGEERPLYIKIPKNEVSALFSTPLEHFMDVASRTEHDGVPLAERQRTERSFGDMWMGRLLSMIPINVNQHEATDPLKWGVGLISMQPGIGMVSALHANEDPFFGREIVPQEEMILPKEYRDNRGQAPKLSRIIAHMLADAGIHEDLVPAPAQFAFMTRQLGGTAATLLGTAGGELVYKAAAASGFPINLDPTKPEDLKLPPGTPPEKVDQLMAAVALEDFRPEWARMGSALIGSAGGQQTARTKSLHMSDQDQEAIKQTKQFFDDYSVSLERIRQERDDLYEAAANGELTHQALDAKLGDLAQQRRGAFEGYRATYPLAVLDPESEKALYARMPGLPINTDKLAANSGNLPPGVDPKMLRDRYAAAGMAAPVDPTTGKPNSFQQAQLRRQALVQMANELGVPASTVKAHISAVPWGELPATPLPQLYLEDALNRWLHPTGVDITTTAHEKQLRRELELKNTAAQFQMDKEELRQRLERMAHNPDEMNEIEFSRQKGMQLSRRVRDPLQFPQFVDSNRRAVVDPAEEDQRLAEMSRYAGKKDWEKPPLIRKLEVAKANGDVKRLEFLLNNPDYQHYVRWFGRGREMTPMDWELYQLGGKGHERYKQGTVAQWNKWDAMDDLYEALPKNDPMRWRLRPQVLQLRRIRTNAWHAQMVVDIEGRRRANYGDELFQLLREET